MPGALQNLWEFLFLEMASHSLEIQSSLPMAKKLGLSLDMDLVQSTNHAKPMQENTALDAIDLSATGSLNLFDQFRLNKHGMTHVTPSPSHSTTSSTSIDLEDLMDTGVLGSGSGGTVRRVIHRPTQRTMALKVINMFSDEGKAQEVLKELSTLYESDCPELIKLYGASYHEGSIYLCLEYMSEGTLADLVMRHVGFPSTEPISSDWQPDFLNPILPNEIIANILYQMCRGLQYLHQRHQIHRDLKPGNVLLNSKGAVKIADFGVTSVLENSIANCQTFCGTLLYMAPERMMGESYSYPADIWSLGLMACEMVFGRYPYPTPKGYFDQLNHVTQGELPPMPLHTCPELAQFIYAALQKDPKQRSTITQLLQSSFFLKYIQASHLSISPKEQMIGLETELAHYLKQKNLRKKRPKTPLESS